MSIPIEQRQIPRPDEFRLGIPVDYSQGSLQASELARKALDKNHIVELTHFPHDQEVLASFCSGFGPLMPKYRATGTTPADYVGDVRFRSDIKLEDRLATEKDGELRPHTAKSWGLERPRYFALLMVNPGWTNQPAEMNGESRFVRAQDAVAEMGLQFPDTFKEDFQLLTSTPVRFTATHIQDETAHMPILFFVDGNGTLGLRYKENMLSVLTKLAPSIENGERYVEAVQRFDEALQTAPHIETLLQPGELIIMDNRVVAHARRTFVSTGTDDIGQVVINPRHLYNIHMQPDLYES
ncbi:hypothetical protein A3A93_03290 [Candidatus Roizmanbacteria bacterium RIFCSPLOWO2_01_FULL_38_12]|uniref:TauD/TfdA-like domain-containing protein n=1 Tax=Candidatus Roizmanbacteria bacterium RIFCSPLOWO2_01_FULL_38_12 TaxID=1802061 RepID=A0A1F7ISM2_9BACT|nr:MAG: hypothetical protein A3F59_03580 [Candidatus Roizmanbacteria bacterium RIFCSPHIGHO2_12_FULL_38_13]OGK46371.1 MAG: hypothetical protein A3A93_03290 [Candidatus Roizmanbacteria bacterium RIFCSPLOWO2_01_FULL_38_12]